MKFYKVKRIITDGITVDERLGKPNLKVYPEVSGHKIKSENIRNLFQKKYINKGNIISKELEALDYFTCWNSTYDIEYDWVKLDLYKICKVLLNIDIRGFLISEKLFNTLSTSDLVFGIAHSFHLAKLKYQNEFLDYYLFQYIFSERLQLLPNRTKLLRKSDNSILINGFNSFKEVNIESRNLRINHERDHMLVYKYNNYSDIIFSKLELALLISEKMKILLENSNIEIFTFQEIDSFKIEFQNQIV